MYNTRSTDSPLLSYYEPPEYEPKVDFSFTRTVKHTRIPHKCAMCKRIIPPNSATVVTFERVEDVTFYTRTCTGINSPPAYNCNIIAGPLGRIGYLVIGDDTVAYFPQQHITPAFDHLEELQTTAVRPHEAVGVVPISYENRRIYG
jgi:hypothetical protein